MPSEMEQALDEILSGVHALLEKSPSASRAHGDRPAAGPGGSHPTHRLTDLAAPASLRIGSDQATSLLAMLAMLESQTSHPSSALASRCIQQLLVARGVALDDIGQDFASVRVSPLIITPLRELARAGAVLVECDAQAGHWDLALADLNKARSAMKRFSAAICPDQSNDKTLWRIPHFPERVKLRWCNKQSDEAMNLSIGAEEFAVIDLDNTTSPASTVFWFGHLWFVPDQLCAMAHHAGEWRPVVSSWTGAAARI